MQMPSQLQSDVTASFGAPDYVADRCARHDACRGGKAFESDEAKQSFVPEETMQCIRVRRGGAELHAGDRRDDAEHPVGLGSDDAEHTSPTRRTPTWRPEQTSKTIEAEQTSEIIEVG